MERLTLSQTNVQLYNQLVRLGYSGDAMEGVQRSYELAARMFSGRFQSTGRDFLCHVIGVSSILADLGQPEAAVRAGLVHNVYANGDFGDSGAAVEHDRREMVRNVVGEDSEELVFHFGSVARELLTRARQDETAIALKGADRLILLMQIVDIVEKRLLDPELANSPRNRRNWERNSAPDARIAEALGFPDLAEIFTMEADPIPIDLLKAERGENRYSFVVLPRSYRKRA